MMDLVTIVNEARINKKEIPISHNKSGGRVLFFILGKKNNCLML